MFWLSVVFPVVMVLAVWPWRWAFRNDTRWGGWAYFDRVAPVVLAVTLVGYVLVWQVIGVLSDGVLNLIGIGLGVCALVVVARFLWLVVKDQIRPVDRTDTLR